MLLLAHTCDVARATPVGTNGRKQLTTLYTAVPTLFLPMSRQAAISNGFDVGFSWDIYFNDGTDVQMGDKLTWNGKSYLVKGVQPFTGLPVVSHLHVMAETEQANGQ